MGSVVGSAGATLMEATTESLYDIETPITLHTLPSPWFAHSFNDNTLLIGKDNTLFPVPLKLTGWPTTQDLTTIAQALDAALESITFQIPSHLGGCLSHINNKTGTYLCWWMPGAMLDTQSLQTQLLHLVDVTRKYHGLNTRISVSIDGQYLDSEGHIHTTPPAIVVNGQTHEQASQTLLDLMVALSFMKPGLLVRQAISTNEKHIPMLIPAPGITENLPAQQCSAHDKIEAASLIETLKGAPWAQSST